jgi:type II secretory pathway pseudopilin PulG
MDTLKKVKAFTLVEMLIVMGIIIILMAVGIASGRFAIRRANKIEHQNAVEQIFQALQSYYTVYKEYPYKEDEGSNLSNLMTSVGEYIDDFEGGSEASYAYHTESTGQEVVICVTYGGLGDTNQLGIYCSGNGIGGTLIPNAPSEKDIEFGTDSYDVAQDLFDGVNCSDWEQEDEWTNECEEISYDPPTLPGGPPEPEEF